VVILAHLGSAHTDAELGILPEQAQVRRSDTTESKHGHLT